MNTLAQQGFVIHVSLPLSYSNQITQINTTGTAIHQSELRLLLWLTICDSRIWEIKPNLNTNKLYKLTWAHENWIRNLWNYKKQIIESLKQTSIRIKTDLY